MKSLNLKAFCAEGTFKINPHSRICCVNFSENISIALVRVNIFLYNVQGLISRTVVEFSLKCVYPTMAGYVFSPAERWGVIWNLHRKALIVDNNQMSNRCITWPRSRIFWIIKDRQISPVISYMTRRPLLNNWVLLQTYLGPNCLSVSDHFVGLALKGLTINSSLIFKPQIKCC